MLKCNAEELACKRFLPAVTWQRIEKGSKSICSTIRSKVKACLCSKYNRLLGVQREQHLGNRRSHSDSHRSQPNTVSSGIDNARVTVIGNIHLSARATNFLSLGPSFSPAQYIDASTCRRVVGGLYKLRDLLRLKVRRDSLPGPTISAARTLLPSAPFPRSFYKEPEPTPLADGKFRILTAGILEVLNRFKNDRRSNLTTEQWQGFKEVRDLIGIKSIRISISDKGGDFVVMPQTLDREIAQLHLSDSSVYQRSTKKEFQAQCRRLNEVWLSVGKAAGLDERFLGRLKLEHPSCPVFYHMVKTHKLAPDEVHSMSPTTFKIRPIVSCVGGPTDRIAWFLTKIVGQLLMKVPSHLSNTRQFIQQLHSIKIESHCVMESFDVTSLYTNVHVDAALQALSELSMTIMMTI